MNFAPNSTYDDYEDVVKVRLDHIIDPTLLRALGLIKDEESVATYFINGQNLVTLMIKYKKGTFETKEVSVIKNYGT